MPPFLNPVHLAMITGRSGRRRPPAGSVEDELVRAELDDLGQWLGVTVRAW